MKNNNAYCNIKYYENYIILSLIYLNIYYLLLYFSSEAIIKKQFNTAYTIVCSIK